MSQARSVVMMSLAALAMSSGVALAQTTRDEGRDIYLASCASCHGVSGRGDGPMLLQLVRPPSDLTTLSRRNGGVFPTQRLWETIDGRWATETGPHGAREMPIWGDVFRAQAGASHPEWFVRYRINALLDFLARVQER